MSEQDLRWAHAQYQPSFRRDVYVLFADYYAGDHRLAFATEKFRSTFGMLFKEFAENLIPAVVDSLADRMEITGFQTSEAVVKTEEVPPAPILKEQGAPARQKVTTDDPLGQKAWDIWTRNQMDTGANEVHVESLLMGDSYLMIWPDDRNRAVLWPQIALEMSVQYDPNVKERIVRASKLWFDDLEGYWRLNVYTETDIQKYQSIKLNDSIPEASLPNDIRGWRQVDLVNNPYGRVPVFHFPNKATRKWGKSRIKDVIPIQDGLNKSVMDLLVTMEFAAYKQRYIIGADPPGDPATGEEVDPAQVSKEYGVNRLMTIPDPEAKVGQFDATDLDQFLRVQEKFWASAARVSGTPLHYFFITQGDFPSGEAMKSAEARFIKEIGDQQDEKGVIWSEAMLFALQVEEGVPEDLEIEVQWDSAQPKSEAELADTAVKKKAVGVPRSQLLREMGYTEAQIERFIQESDAETMSNFLMGNRQGMDQSQQQTQRETVGGRTPSRAQPAGQNTRGVRQ